jgi:hypothetical protein
MCPKVKRYKGKEMGAFSSAEMGQKACLEGDTDSEGKVKKVLRNIRSAGLKSKYLHLGFLVDVVLAGVAEAVFKAPGFGRKSPDQALSCGEGFGGAVEHFVLESEGGIDPLPASGLKSSHHVGKDQGVERVVVDEQGVANVAA